MIHRNDERVFRFVELTCYFSLFVGEIVLRRVHFVAWAYAIPLLLFLLSSAGLVFMARFFIYAHPERVHDRKRAETIEIPRRKQILLMIGFAMCGPMFVLGVIGLFDPPTLDRVILVIPPMRWLLS